MTEEVKAARKAKIEVELANGIKGWTTKTGVAVKVNKDTVDKGVLRLLAAHQAADKDVRVMLPKDAITEAVVKALYGAGARFTLYFDEGAKSKKAKRADAIAAYAASAKSPADAATFASTIAEIDA